MRRIHAILVAAALLVGACGSGGAGADLGPDQGIDPGVDLAGATLCNGHAELCARRYDQVAFAGNHNAYSNVAEGFGAPDQSFPIDRQLADGVRVLHLEIQEFEGDAHVCHGLCQIGERLLSNELAIVARFLDAHPREVVSLLMEQSGVPVAQIVAAFHATGLDRRAWVRTAGAPFATLGAMLDAGTPLVAYLDTTTPDAPWLLDRWRTTWETPWDNQIPADFTRCYADRGDEANPIYVVDNYYEDMIVPTAAGARRINLNPMLVDRLTHCRDTIGRLPNFVMMNYYEVGDVFAVVDYLNGLSSSAHPDWDAFPPLDAAPTPMDAGAPDLTTRD